MRLWKSALKSVLFRSAASTHSSPSTLRRVFIPFSYALFAIALACCGCSGEISGELREQLLDLGFAARECARFAVRPHVGLHPCGIDDERRRDRIDEIEARAEGGG